MARPRGAHMALINGDRLTNNTFSGSQNKLEDSGFKILTRQNKTVLELSDSVQTLGKRFRIDDAVSTNDGLEIRGNQASSEQDLFKVFRNSNGKTQFALQNPGESTKKVEINLEAGTANFTGLTITADGYAGPVDGFTGIGTAANKDWTGSVAENDQNLVTSHGVWDYIDEKNLAQYQTTNHGVTSLSGHETSTVKYPYCAALGNAAAYDVTAGNLINSNMLVVKSFADTSYASISHNHDTSYASISHNHDTSYAAISHNHDASYASISHNHDSDYAPASLETTVTSNTSSISTLNSLVSSAETAIASAETAITAAETAIASAETAIASAESDISSIQTSLTSKISTDTDASLDYLTLGQSPVVPGSAPVFPLKIEQQYTTAVGLANDFGVGQEFRFNQGVNDTSVNPTTQGQLYCYFKSGARTTAPYAGIKMTAKDDNSQRVLLDIYHQAPADDGKSVMVVGQDGDGTVQAQYITLTETITAANFLHIKTGNVASGMALYRFEGSNNSYDMNTTSPTKVPWTARYVDSNLYSNSTAGSIVVAAAGLYKVSFTILLTSTVQRVNPTIGLFINNVSNGEVAWSYSRGADNHNESSWSISPTLVSLSANDFIQVKGTYTVNGRTGAAYVYKLDTATAKAFPYLFVERVA